MFVFGGLFRRSRVEQPRNRREHIVQGSRHPQGWSERKQVFIISCKVEGGFIVSNWILTCPSNRDIIQMWCTLPVVGPLRMVLLLYDSLVVRRCMSCCSMIITPPMNVFSLQSCEAWNWFDVECKSTVSNWMLTCG